LADVHYIDNDSKTTPQLAESYKQKTWNSSIWPGKIKNAGGSVLEIVIVKRKPTIRRMVKNIVDVLLISKPMDVIDGECKRNTSRLQEKGAVEAEEETSKDNFW
jgi:hypothetical protein